jgi:hypothetical protein
MEIMTRNLGVFSGVARFKKFKLLAHLLLDIFKIV